MSWVWIVVYRTTASSDSRQSYKFMGTTGAFIIVEDTQDVGCDHVTTPMSRVRCVATGQPQVTRNHHLSPSLHPRSGKLIPIKDQRICKIKYCSLRGFNKRYLMFTRWWWISGILPKFFSHCPAVYFCWPPVATPRLKETYFTKRRKKKSIIQDRNESKMKLQ